MSISGHPFDEELSARLDDLRRQGLRRELRPIHSAQGVEVAMAGRTFLNFSSNDYLGLANDPILKEAAIRAVERYGAGSGASRLICGSLAPHHELEEALAAFKGAEAALAFSSGYATALSVVCALVGKDDVVIIDKLIHASLVDAAKLSGATLRVFRHNDLDQLESHLQWAASRPQASGHGPASRTLVITEGIFSMDGDRAPLREIVGLKDRFGAWLMVDEAHSGGILGARGRGLVESLDLQGRVEVQMGTLGKALGSAGGYICGSRVLVDYLINRARGFVFSTAPVPAAAAAATAALNFLSTEEGRRRRKTLWDRAELAAAHWGGQACPGPIYPVLIGGEEEASVIATTLRERAVCIPAIRYPTVARGRARLRLTVTAAHSREQIESLVPMLQSLGLPRVTSPVSADA